MKLLNALFGSKQQNAFCFIVPVALMVVILVHLAS